MSCAEFCMHLITVRILELGTGWRKKRGSGGCGGGVGVDGVYGVCAS